jgi:O-antigen/teichoic acid export membrane protein
MTTRVVKGSIWTLVGQVLPMGISFLATPIVIRLLGTEGYGVYILVLLIPNFLAFADLGMNVASTKFASEAYAGGSRDLEARRVRTAALIALCGSVPLAIGLVTMAHRIVELFNVPAHLQPEAALALRLAAVLFVLNFLNMIFNTPQLARLRMDLNVLVTAGFRILGTIAAPLVIYLGGGIVGAVSVGLAVGLATLAGHLAVSSRLLPDLIGFSIDRDAMRPMLRFGGSLLVAGVAAVALINLEKFVLTRATSVETLAHYAVAATFASMITLVSGSIVQSLVPAFSQLQGEERRGQLSALYSRAIRMAAIGIVPGIVMLALIARPFFTVWAGEDFGRESTLPFYLILPGITLNVLAFFPWALLMAAGRSDVFAKVYWLELVLYIPLVWWAAVRFGAPGVAATWSLRAAADTFLLFAFASLGAKARFISTHFGFFAAGVCVMLVPLASAFYFGGLGPAVVVLFILALAVYAAIIWRRVLALEEVVWLKGRLAAYSSRFS